MGEWQRPRVPRTADQQYVRNGGGLCLFWSPGFGTSLLAKNWTTWSAQSIVARTMRQEEKWEDYWSVETDFQPEAGQLVVTGSLANLPIAFEKTWRFREQRVEGTLTLKAERAVQLCCLEATFPHAADGPKVTLLDEDGRPARDTLARAARFEKDGDEVHVLVFDRLQTVEVREVESVDHYGKSRRHNCLVLDLPAQWREGGERSFLFAIAPAKTARSEAVVQELARQFE
jgi:hypothetical protein